MLKESIRCTTHAWEVRTLSEWVRKSESIEFYIFKDSGGPLVAKDGGIPIQIGIVSFVSSRGCAEGKFMVMV